MKFAGQFLFVIVAICFCGCAEEPSDDHEKEDFVRIYDYNGFAESFRPVDMVQTPDNGFLLVAGRDRQVDSPERGIYLLKVRDDGSVERDLVLENSYVRPVPGLFEVNGNYYFFCMNSFSEAVLVEADASLENINYYPTGLSYPAAVSYSGSEGFLLFRAAQGERRSHLPAALFGETVDRRRSLPMPSSRRPGGLAVHADYLMPRLLQRGETGHGEVGRAEKG